MGCRDKCAVFGVRGHDSAAFLTYLGLYALQHRGQEGAGIVSHRGGRFFSHKGPGLVGQVFSKEKLRGLKGESAIGHTRYATSGSSARRNIQPLQKNMPFGPVALSHNGNIVNLAPENSEDGESDTERLFPLIEAAAKAKGASVSADSAGEVFHKALQRAEGAFSLLALTPFALLGMRDPLGFRPLVLGRKDGAYVLASETVAFDLIGADYIREIEPGEIVIIDDRGIRSLYLPPKGKKALCVFEYVYFSRPDSFVFSESVYERRKKMGAKLARESPAEADIVVPVPDSGTPAAIGFAEESGLPFEMGIVRNHYIGRTFIHPLKEERDFSLKIKLNPLKSLLKGKRVVAVDDSIVRGATSKALVRILKEAGAREIHLRVSSPPVRGPCFYGVDTPEKKTAHLLLPQKLGKPKGVSWGGLHSLSVAERAGGGGREKALLPRLL